MNKVVYVTGGSQGIGKAIALAFSRAGATVVISARSAQDVEQAVNEIRTAGSCEGYPLDVRDAGAVQKVIADIVSKHQRIDALVTCAGIYGPIGKFDQSGIDAWKEVIDINLVGTVNVVHAVVPVMKKQGSGTIITMAGAGVGGKVKPNLSAYTTSKYAVYGFTESLALELKEHNISINAIAPGAVNTRILNQVLEAGEAAGKDFLEASKKQKETGGIPPEKAAGLALFLCSEAGQHVTGKLISAVWDDYENFGQKSEGLSRSLYNLRRIDDNLFTEK